MTGLAPTCLKHAFSSAADLLGALRDLLDLQHCEAHRGRVFHTLRIERTQIYSEHGHARRGVAPRQADTQVTHHIKATTEKGLLHVGTLAAWWVLVPAARISPARIIISRLHFDDARWVYSVSCMQRGLVPEATLEVVMLDQRAAQHVTPRAGRIRVRSRDPSTGVKRARHAVLRAGGIQSRSATS